MSDTPRCSPGAAPPLAGVCSYEEAARIGFSVDENVRRLLRYHWVERRAMRIMVRRVAATPEWEVKGALALHVWLAAERADRIRRRIVEMRTPAPRLDVAPDPALDRALDEVDSAATTSELLTGLHGVLLESLAETYHEHLAGTNPLVDHPTRRMLAHNLLDLDETLVWGRAALASLGADEAFERHVRAYVAAAGGLAGDRPPIEAPAPRAAVEPDFVPRRDERFGGAHNFNFPPHVLYNAPNVPADERNLALLCKRLLEMDVPEMMSSFLAERTDQPWRFYVDYARQTWDEARHSMMGEAALEARGVDWTALPLNVGFALRLNLHAEPLERQIMLWAIEQSLMPADTGKRFEHATAVEAGDALSAHFHDYDWADEVLHAQIGRRWLLGDEGEGLSFQDAMDAGRAVHDKTWPELERYRGTEPQSEWWSDFVRGVLGRETSAEAHQLIEDPTVIAE